MAPQSVYPKLTHCMSRVPGKFACRILIQEIGFALPVTITVPVVVSLPITFGALRNSNPCYFSGVIPDYLFFNPPEFYDLGEFFATEVRNHCLLQKMAYMQKLIINCVKETNLMHKLFLVYFVNFYMFRTYLGPSSGGTTICIQQLVLNILCRCRICSMFCYTIQ